MDAFEDFGDARAIAQVIVEPIREPVLILNRDFRILMATNSFLELFGISQGAFKGVRIFELQGGAWNIPLLARLLERTVADQVPTENLELTHDFPGAGNRTLLLNTRLVNYGDVHRATVFLSFEDTSRRKLIEHEQAQLQERTQELLRQKEFLLREMEHRVVNSLQIIASILLLKAKAVSSPETRYHLEDAHRRVMSIAAVQQHLHALSHVETVDMSPYLEKLCQSLSDSIIAEGKNTQLTVTADAGNVTSADAVSLGLIVTELVINALKYAFPDGCDSAVVHVHYEKKETDWRLSLTDNGSGMAHDAGKRPKTGLGTSLLQALAAQMDAKVSIKSTNSGTSVAITYATF
jgi:two-component sensor histidine kinase